MAIYRGSKPVTALYRGGSAIMRAYRSERLVWESTESGTGNIGYGWKENGRILTFHMVNSYGSEAYELSGSELTVTI